LQVLHVHLEAPATLAVQTPPVVIAQPQHLMMAKTVQHLVSHSASSCKFCYTWSIGKCDSLCLLLLHLRCMNQCASDEFHSQD